MKQIGTITKLCQLMLLAIITSLSYSVFGAGKAMVLPGLHQQGEDLDGNPLSSQQVLDWEIANSDIIFGAYDSAADNHRARNIGYMYNQKLEMNSSWLEHHIRSDAEEKGLNYEDFFLHFAEDTVVAEVDQTHGENTLLNRKPMIVGYTVNHEHAGFWLYQQPPWDVDVFEHAQQGGALYVYHAEQFDRLVFKFSQTAQGGSFVIEYPSQVDAYGQVTQWSPFDIKKDKTLNMTKSQNVIWQMPSDWVRATTHDGSGASYGGGQYFGSTYLRDGGQLYVVRVRWDADSVATRPKIKEVKLKNSFPVVKLSDAPIATSDGRSIQRWRKIRGFDLSADTNQDNYLDWNEYKNRSNKNATARFRWESRVIPFGRMWNQNSSWALTHLANPDYIEAMRAYYAAVWQEQGVNGAYNDDTNKLLGQNQFYVQSGGMVAELGMIAGSELADERYKTDFATFLRGLAAFNPDTLIGANIGTANLYGRNGQSHLTGAANLYLREHYLFPSTGFSGYAGISKFWDNSVLAASGQSTIFQATTRYGRVQYLGNTEQHWQQDQYSALAIYYLNHHTDKSFFNQWNNGYVYGSNNTDAVNFWRAGIAKNIAYQPTKLLAIDLGEPANTLPAEFEAIPLMLSTATPYPADYTIVGDSTMNQAAHPDLPSGMIELLPTYTYFIYQSANEVVPQGPEDMVLAREFTKGKVLYRTDFHGRNQSFYTSDKITIELDVPMRPVDAQGTVGDYVSRVELGGYEGMFLLY